MFTGFYVQETAWYWLLISCSACFLLSVKRHTRVPATPEHGGNYTFPVPKWVLVHFANRKCLLPAPRYSDRRTLTVHHIISSLVASTVLRGPP
ncbi:hypothetical protein F5878DRAFT_612618 [Lentinula raphanica]|uniref:Uncharacterized protein n=1 Tax=Lentinula raphanica TaxID=153919 RepID=A0AA38UGT1_9AGAR|nr:hypothetical protein F5878DRAFT_612618 [Lentinula raphanica]